MAARCEEEDNNAACCMLESLLYDVIGAPGDACEGRSITADGTMLPLDLRRVLLLLSALILQGV